MSQTTFAIGRRWRCEREGKPAFDFVIVEKGSSGGTKKCRLECDSPNQPGHGLVQEYSHAHIKKHARLLPLDSSDEKIGSLALRAAELEAALRPFAQIAPVVAALQDSGDVLHVWSTRAGEAVITRTMVKRAYDVLGGRPGVQ